MGTDVAEQADGVRVGFQPGRQVAGLDQPVDEALQRPGAGWLVDPPPVDLADNVIQHLAGRHHRQVGGEVGNQGGLPDGVPDFTELVGEAVQEGKQRLE
jgi:hypothetical protein